MVNKRWQPTRAVQALGLATSLLVAPLAQAQSMPGDGSGGYGGSGSGSGSGSDGPSDADKGTAQDGLAYYQDLLGAAALAAWNKIYGSIPDPNNYIDLNTYREKDKFTDLFADYKWKQDASQASKAGGIAFLIGTAGQMMCDGLSNYLLDGHKAWIAAQTYNPGHLGGPWARWENFKQDEPRFRETTTGSCVGLITAIVSATSKLAGMWTKCTWGALLSWGGIWECANKVEDMLKAMQELDIANKTLDIYLLDFVPNYKTLGQRMQSITNARAKCEQETGKMNRLYYSVDGIHVAPGFVDPVNAQPNRDPDTKNYTLDTPVINELPGVPIFVKEVTARGLQACLPGFMNWWGNACLGIPEKKVKVVDVKGYYRQAMVDAYPYSAPLIGDEYCGTAIGATQGLYNLPDGSSCTDGHGLLLRNRRAETTSTAGDLAPKIMTAHAQQVPEPMYWHHFWHRCAQNSPNGMIKSECRETQEGLGDYQCRPIVHSSGGGGGFGGGY